MTLVTYEQAAAILGCHVSNVPKLNRKGQLVRPHRVVADGRLEGPRWLSARCHCSRIDISAEGRAVIHKV